MAPMDTDSDALSQRLERLLIKDGVSLGGLSADDLALALAWVWLGLPAGDVHTEPQVNALLKQQLAGPATALSTDHVELRRWLVDAGWLQRDGYGREYRRSAEAPQAWSALARSLQQVLAGTDTGAWTARRRQARAAEREARRQRWQVAQGEGRAPGSASASISGA
jgi:Uncharacterized protein conserved in bacteria (DUF2087)